MKKIFLALFFIAGCSSLSKSDKETADLHLQIGTSYLQNGSYPQAMSELQQAEKLDPSNKYIQNNLGLAYFVREKFDAADKHFRQALSLDENFSDARNNLGKTLIEEGQYKDAVKEINVVLNDLTYIYPERPLLNMGIAKYKMGDYNSARDYFLKTLNVKRDSCLAHSYYGKTLFEIRDYEKAAHALDKAVGFCQKELFDEPHYYAALAYYRLKSYEKAEVRCKEVINLYPNGKFTEKAKTLLTEVKKHL